MYPTRELIRLSSHKAALRRRLAVRRNRISQDASEVMRPFLLVKPLWVICRAASPLAVFALEGFARRSIFPRLSRFRSVLRWSPFLADMLRLAFVRFKNRHNTST